MNIVILKGRLTKAPELRTTTNGVNVCTFSLAVPKTYARDEVDFFDCVAWRGTADFISKYFEKGQEMLLNGSVEVRKWQDKDGNNRYSTEIIVNNAEFCGAKATNNNISESKNETEGFKKVSDDIINDLPWED